MCGTARHVRAIDHDPVGRAITLKQDAALKFLVRAAQKEALSASTLSLGRRSSVSWPIRHTERQHIRQHQDQITLAVRTFL
jgi:hypothetical protein